VRAIMMNRSCSKAVAALGAVLVFGLAAGAMSASAASAQAAPASPSKRMARPYDGFPPLVPHDVEERKALCQECHTTGVDGAPITPHPTRAHYCVTCHVEQDLRVGPFEKAKPAR
jgi:nitrate reductase cytochrome c-type subunit